RTSVEQLISVNKVHWINGEGTSGITSLIQPVVESAGLPMTCHPCASPTLTEKGLKWFFRTGPNDKTMVASVFSFLHEWRDKGGPTNLKTIAFFMCDNRFCQDNHQAASELALQAGYQVVHDRQAWKKVNESYKKYSRGQNMGELAMREITGLLWMADVINRAKSVEPAALQKAANETKMGPEQLIIDYKGVQFENGQNVLATGVVTQIGWDGEKHTVWPWDLAAKSGFKAVYPSPSWQ